ncbi:MAG: autotransporter-associated beta strand repeat-containing protein, partial [Kiritimatiellia bacterium]
MGSSSETTGALTVSSGANTIYTGEALFGQTSTLTFASLNMTGGTLAFTGANLGVTDRNRIFFTTPPTPNSGGNIGVGGSNATYGNLGFARYDLVQGVVLAPSDATISVRGGQIPDALTSSIRIDETGSSGNITLQLPNTTVNTLLQDAISEARVDMAGQILAVNTVLVASGRGIMTFGTAPNSGVLTSATYGGNIELNNSSISPMTVNATVANNGGAVSLVKSGTGTLVLAGASTYTGVTAVQEGVLQLAGADRLPVNTLVTLGSGSSSGVLQLNGNSQSVGGVVPSGSGTANKVVNGSATAGNLTLSGGSTTSALLGGAGLNENNFSLTSAGSPTLTGGNTFTGDVTLRKGASLTVPVIALSGPQPLGMAATAINFQGDIILGSTLVYSGAGNGATNRGLNMESGLGGTVNVSQATATLTLNGVLSGGADFRKAGAG